MKINILQDDHRLGRDGYDNYVVLVLKAGRRIFRICDGTDIFGEDNIQGGYEPRYYFCDHHGYRTSWGTMPPLEQQVWNFALAYLRLNPTP